VRPACRDGDAAPPRPRSERAFGSDPPADSVPAAAAARGGGHEGGVEGGPAVEGDPVLVGVLAAGSPPQQLQRSCTAPARPRDATPPPSSPHGTAFGGLFGVTPEEHPQLCPAWARSPICWMGG